MSNFNVERKQKADKYLAEQIRICSRIFQCAPEDFRLPTQAEDFNGVDLFYGKIRIALRVRHRQLKDLTLRLSKDKNGISELEKIMNQNMDYILQCESDKLRPEKINTWDLFDVQELLPALDSELVSKQEFNLSSDKHFVCYSIDDLSKYFPRSFLARGVTIEEEILNDDDGTVRVQPRRVTLFHLRVICGQETTASTPKV